MSTAHVREAIASAQRARRRQAKSESQARWKAKQLAIVRGEISDPHAPRCLRSGAHRLDQLAYVPLKGLIASALAMRAHVVTRR